MRRFLCPNCRNNGARRASPLRFDVCGFGRAKGTKNILTRKKAKKAPVVNCLRADDLISSTRIIARKSLQKRISGKGAAALFFRKCGNVAESAQIAPLKLTVAKRILHEQKFFTVRVLTLPHKYSGFKATAQCGKGSAGRQSGSLPNPHKKIIGVYSPGGIVLLPLRNDWSV